jgi:hypothetical protein
LKKERGLVPGGINPFFGEITIVCLPQALQGKGNVP